MSLITKFLQQYLQIGMKEKQNNFQFIYKEALKQCGLPDIQNRQQCLILTKSYQKPKVKKTLSNNCQQLLISHLRNFSSDKKLQSISKTNLWQKKYSLNSLKGSNNLGKLASINQLSQQNSKTNTVNFDQKLIKISTQVSISARQNDKNKQMREKFVMLQQYNSKNLKNKKIGLNPTKPNWKQWQKQQIQDINDFIQFVDSSKGRQSKNLFYKKTA